GAAGFGGGFHDPFDIFREVFGGGGGGIFESFFGGGGGGRAEERQRGSDLRYDMQITLEEAAFGTEKEIEIRKLDTCDQCIGNGSRLRSSRNGEAGIRGGPPGDLYVVLHIKEHPVFRRDEDDLYCEVPISFPLAALGGEVPVPTLEGKANVKIPAGTQSGQI